MKTPEELAEEYCEDHDECEFAYEAFLAGYEAAKDQLAVSDKVMPRKDSDLLHDVANDYLNMKAAKYRRVCGYKK